MNNSFDRGGTCGEWTKNDCMFNVDKCVKEQAYAYNDPSEYRATTGPNSNTFAGTIARSCKLKKPNVSAISTPGWNDSPAPLKK